MPGHAASYFHHGGDTPCGETVTEDSRLINNELVLQQLINSLESDILLVR